ncbi:unnamed protein product [Oreochromis niloticus]|nr:unnamed protein product [Mustela putorius furo]
MTVGEKNPSKTNKTILIVGETGAGKSTLINALFNYTIGVKWEDEVWFQIVEEGKRSQSESQTSDVIVYEIFGFEDKTLPYSLTIIDTPGFGDTRGAERDEIVIRRLLQLFGSDNGVHEVHAVGLVMKAADNRLTDRLMYIFSSMMSLFGKDVEKNIVALITHSDGATPKNVLKALEDAKIKCAKNDKNQPAHFLFNNRTNEARTDEEEFALEFAWKVTEKGMRQLRTFMEKTAPQNMKKTVEVMNSRIRLTECIKNLKGRIELTELKETEIRQIQEALKEHEEEMKKNKNFTIDVDEPYKVKENVKGGWWGFWPICYYDGVTSCKVCKENCHETTCTWAKTPKDCEVMKGGRCTVCTKNCPVSDHEKEVWRYVNKTRKVQKTVEEIKEKYEKNETETKNKGSVLENLKKEKNQLTAEKSKLLYESYQHVVTLEQIALKADSVSTIVHLDFLIEKMKEEGDTEKVQKLKDMRSREGEGTISALFYRFGKLFKT